MKPTQPTAEGGRGKLVALLLGLALLALAARLLVLPLATADGSDGVARTWIGWRWLSDPEFITHGVWGPLHTYLIGAVLAVIPDPVHGPVGLHVFFGIVAPCLIYAFTRIEFGSPRAALLVAALYALYPVAIRNSVSVRSEAPLVAFLLGAMVLLALARSERGRPAHAVAAGLLVTLAAMLRYEAWMLIPFLGLTLWPRVRWLILFGAIALIHPLLWMIGNAVATGDPWYSFNWGANWEQNLMGKAGEPFLLHLDQALAYPLVILKGMHVALGLGAVAGAVLALLTRHRARVWLAASAGLALLMLVSIARGLLVPKLNYTVTPGTLLWPFTALVVIRLGVDRWSPRRFGLATVGALATMALFLGLVAREGRGSYRAGQWTLSPVPRIPNQDEALSLPPRITAALRSPAEGLISDFYGWGTTHYVALLTRLHPDRIFTAPGAPNQELDPARLQEFLDRHPAGVILLLRGSRFDRALRPESATGAGTAGRPLALQPIDSVPWPPRSMLEILRYRVDP